MNEAAPSAQERERSWKGTLSLPCPQVPLPHLLCHFQGWNPTISSLSQFLTLFQWGNFSWAVSPVNGHWWRGEGEAVGVWLWFPHFSGLKEVLVAPGCPWKSSTSPLPWSITGEWINSLVAVHLHCKFNQLFQHHNACLEASKEEKGWFKLHEQQNSQCSSWQQRSVAFL